MALSSADTFDSLSWPLSLIIFTLCVAGTILAVFRFIRRNNLDIPGPVDNASFLYGNLPELLLAQPYGKFEFQWQEQYGSTYRFKGCFSEDFLFTSDPAALRHILNAAKVFDFSHNRTFMVSAILGKDSMAALQIGGETHRRIRSAFAPAFTSTRLQPYIPVIRDIARKAANKLRQQYLKRNEQTAVIDIYQLIQHVTSDVIGEVGFGDKFDAVETDGGSEVVQMHQNVVLLGAKTSKAAILGEGVIPYLPPEMLKMMLHLPIRTFRMLQEFCRVSEAWAEELLTKNLQFKDSTEAGLVGFVASANEDQKRQRLSFREISCQTSVLLIAGQDTTANSLAWAIHELAKRLEWQDRIRKELTEAQDVDSNLDKFECLNAHIKETLRYHPGVPLTERVAFEDTVIPLSQPLTTASGRVITELPIKKGQTLYLGLASYNRNPEVWGPDANLFDPVRWLDGRYDKGSLPSSMGPYSSLASFSGGPRVCLGWRLGILELQIVLFELISKFRLTFAPEQESKLTSSFALTLLPLDAESGKPSLPIVVQPV